MAAANAMRQNRMAAANAMRQMRAFAKWRGSPQRLRKRSTPSAAK